MRAPIATLHDRDLETHYDHWVRLELFGSKVMEKKRKQRK